MNILYILPEDICGNRRGGVTTSTITLAESLAQNHTVTLLSRADTDCFYQKKYKVVRLTDYWPSSLFGKIIYYLLTHLVGKLFPEFVSRINWSLNIFKYVKKNKHFDIIESPEWGNGSFFVSLFTQNNVLVKLHRGWLCYFKDNQLPITLDILLVHLLESISIILAKGIISPSRSIISFYQKQITIYGKIHRKGLIKIIPYGVDTGSTNKYPASPQKNSYILIIGRLEKAKGSLCAIKAFLSISKEFHNIKLIMIGEDTNMTINDRFVSYKAYLNKIIDSNNANKQIIILHRKSGNELKKYLQNCLFLVCPSIGNENLPMVILEALSYSKSIIASNTGGLPELIKNNVNGLLFEQNNYHDLSSKMGLLLTDNAMRKRFEKNNSFYKNNFSINIIAPKVLAFYKKIVDSS